MLSCWYYNTLQADIAGTSLVPCLTISELSNSNWFEPKDPSLLAKHYFENPRIDSPDTAGTAESDERVSFQGFIVSGFLQVSSELFSLF